MMGEHWWLIGKETIRWSGHDYLDEGHDDIDADELYKKAGWQGLAGFRGPHQNPSELS